MCRPLSSAAGSIGITLPRSRRPQARLRRCQPSSRWRLRPSRRSSPRHLSRELSRRQGRLSEIRSMGAVIAHMIMRGTGVDVVAEVPTAGRADASRFAILNEAVFSLMKMPDGQCHIAHPAGPEMQNNSFFEPPRHSELSDCQDSSRGLMRLEADGGEQRAMVRNTQKRFHPSRTRGQRPPQHAQGNFLRRVRD